MWVEKEKGFLVIRICLIVPTVTVFVLGLSQQADHADFAELGNGEINNRIGGRVEIFCLFGIWNWPNLDRLTDLILEILDACSDLDAGDLRCHIPRVGDLRHKDIDHNHLTAGKGHIDSEGFIVMKD